VTRTAGRYGTQNRHCPKMNTSDWNLEVDISLQADTRNLPIYEADQKHIPDKIGMSDREKGELLKQSTKIGFN